MTTPRLGPWELKELVQELDRQRTAGRRIVFTNGVFDLIHPGHIRYLRAARAMGDLLVVAVNSDASVRRLKGPKRPILAENERARILAALEFVDYVVLFSADTPLETLKAVRPNVLVKGADYALNEIVGRNEVESWGGEVRTVELVHGASSTDVVQRIVESQHKV